MYIYFINVLNIHCIFEIVCKIKTINKKMMSVLNCVLGHQLIPLVIENLLNRYTGTNVAFSEQGI